MTEQELKGKILKEQDLIGQSLSEIYESFEQYIREPKMSFKDISNIIIKDDYMLNNLKINNLTKVLAYLDLDKNKEDVEKIRIIINDRIDKEDFFVEDSESAPFLNTVHSVNLLPKMLGEEVYGKLKEQVLKGLDKLKGTEVEKVSSKINTYFDGANFIKYQKDGIFTKEKIAMLEGMLERNKHALEYTNFGLFRDNIYDKFSNEFIEYISKFPKLSNKIINLEESNPKLYQVFVDRVNGYDNLIDNYSEIQTMIEGFSKNAYEVELKEVNNDTCEKLINWLGIKNQEKDLDFLSSNKDIPLVYSEDYQEKLNNYWDSKFETIQKEKSESLLKLEEKRQELQQINNLLENETDRKKKLDYELKKMGLDSSILVLSEKVEKSENQIKECYFQRKFSMSLKDAKRLIKEYGSDLDNIEGIDYEKNFFFALKEGIDYQDKIEEFYNSKDINYSFTNIEKIKQNIAKECAKSYAQNLKDVKNKVDDIIQNKYEELYEQVDVEGEKVDIVKIKGKFDLFLHSTDTGFIYDKQLEEDYNFKDAWHEQKNKSDHILSTAYTNQDFMGAPPLNNNGVMYGFASIPRENIRLMGVTDINTYNRQFAYDSSTKQYMTAKTMPYSARRVYSEFAIEKKDPDYVVLYDDATEEIKNNTLKAAKQFGIPVAYIDKQEIVNNQIENLNSLIEEFEKTGDTKKLTTLINRYETNVSGWLLNRKDGQDESHTKDIDNSRFKDNFKEVENKIQTIVSNYLDRAEVSKDDMSQELSEIATTILTEKQLYEDCLSGGSDKKISGTQMSLDSGKILGRLNNIFEKKGMTNLIVNENTDLQQYIKMKEVAKNAICRERISTSQVKAALSVESPNRDMEAKMI